MTAAPVHMAWPRMPPTVTPRGSSLAARLCVCVYECMPGCVFVCMSVCQAVYLCVLVYARLCV
jgi:hypothetical protein